MLLDQHETATITLLLTGDDALVDDHFAVLVLNLSEAEHRPATLPARER